MYIKCICVCFYVYIYLCVDNKFQASYNCDNVRRELLHWMFYEYRVIKSY